MSRLFSRALFAVVVLCSVLAYADEDDSQGTSDAFSALLSMPQAQPEGEGRWEVFAPEDFKATDETGLIEYLSNQNPDMQKVAFHGTLLQHAVRANMKDVAMWLISQGADPLATVAGFLHEPDALGLAIYMGHWSIVDALLALPVYQRLSAQQLTDRYLVQNPTSLDELLARHFAAPTGKLGACMLKYELERGAVQQALEVDSRQLPAPGELDRYGDCQGVHPSEDQSARGSFKTVDLVAWKKLDTQMLSPIFGYLLQTLASADDVKALFASDLRRPDQPEELAKVLLPWMVARPRTSSGIDPAPLPFAARKALAEHLPATVLSPWLADSNNLYSWLAIAAADSFEAFSWALALVPDETLTAKSADAAHAGLQGVRTIEQRQMIGAALLQRSALRLDGQHVPRLLYAVPISLWPELFRHGYRVENTLAIEGGEHSHQPDEISDWLGRPVADLQQSWPLMTAQLPGLADSVIEKLMRPFGRKPFTCTSVSDSPQADQITNLTALIQLGAVVHPLSFPKACALNTAPKVYAQLLALGVVAPVADVASAARFVFEPVKCNFLPSDGLLKSLLAPDEEGDYSRQLHFETVQLLDVPESDNCAMVVSGFWNMVGSVDNDDFMWGYERMNPCGDRPEVTESRLERHGAIEAVRFAGGASAGLLGLRDTQDGRRYYLAYAESGDRCSGGLAPHLLAWTKSAPYYLEEVSAYAPVAQALQAQCDLQGDLNACLDAADNSREGHSTTWDAPHDVDEFIYDTFTAQRDDYLGAVQSFDLTRLHRWGQTPVPPKWTLAAIDAVSHATLSVPEKRRRIAWLFKKPAQLKAALEKRESDEVILDLADWLPREDWRPLITALHVESTPPSVEPWSTLASEAQSSKNPKAACQFLTVVGLPCH
ncbi:hypothetical protein HX866_26995 [Pseudomonas gingeri]|uniref:hypothetical protein n=1 Tax=Pseudomonas gingeri TaxID=117681 RepID=UPI0015A22338|nr:hypothetical protein [Pseudomonas gingeri]NWA28542.1 hypothetical protein [Pseudomonas gingeri]